MEESGNKRFEDALTLLEERRFREAIEAFSDLVALAPDMTGAYGNRGLCYLNLGLDNEARSDFETVLQLDPDDAMGHSMLAELDRFRAPLADTLAHINDALAINPDEPQAHFIRGWLFARAGQFEMAAADLKRHMELTEEQENADVAELLAACMTLAGDSPVGDDGQPVDTREKVDAFLGARGWSFNYQPQPDFEERGAPCRYAHCIRNCPPLDPDASDGCPVFGYACPGGIEVVEWCRERSPLLD